MNTKSVTVRNENGFATAQEIQASANLIQQVMKAVMKENVHYGKVPGCGDKPTLLKPGAEKILSTFRISVDPQIEDLSDSDSVKYRVKARGLHTRSDGAVIEMGSGVGVCSSGEEKYKWRKAIGNEFEETPEDRKRTKWKRGKTGEYQERQVRTSPSDLENTILKMAKKRALVDLCLTATAASDCFNQDVEDLPAEYIAESAEDDQLETIAMPQPKKQEKPIETPTPTPEILSEHITESAPKSGSGYRVLKAKYAGICRGCGKEIHVGMDIAYSKEKGNFHQECAK